MKRWMKALIGGVCLCLLLSLCGFTGECEKIRDRVVRLHILANSDSDEDQALKLKVRDAVTEAAAGWLDDAEGEGEALQKMERYLPELQEVAQQTVYDEGYSYPVTATLCRMHFDTREYDEVTMPAGIYDAVRFTIGEGQGKNWWCVMFPPLCVPVADGSVETDDGVVLEEYLNEDGKRIVTSGNRYKVKFKVVEWYEKLFK